jgi:hypothetical protein
MGLLTLTNFRDDLQAALGNKGHVNGTLDRWINLAYLDVTGSEAFEALTSEDTSQSTVSGTNSVNVPPGAHVVIVVRNTATDTKLDWLPKEEYWRYSQSSSGSPTKWTRQANKILLHPVPNAIQALRIVSTKSPTVLSGTSDLTAIPDTWDAAIFMISVHYGLLARGEEQRAMIWLQRAVAYMQSRMTEASVHMTTRGLEPQLGVQGGK